MTRRCSFYTLLAVLVLLTLGALMAPNMMTRADLWFDTVLAASRVPALLTLFAWVTYLGDTAVVIALAALIAAWLYFSKRDQAYIMGLAVALIGAAGTGYLMKILVARARPDGLIPAISETGFSFPSGHSTAAMALYGFAAYLLCRLYPAKRILILTVSTLIVIAVGFSRLYLGVHFPSDVLAGFAVGGLWVLLAAVLTKKLQARSS